MPAAETVNTKRVTGRRTVHYESFSEILADAERLAAIPTRTLGNWSVGQIYTHLARSIDVMIDGAPVSAPLPMRWFLRAIKGWILKRPLPTGYRLPKQAARLVPEPTISTEAGLACLRTAIDRIQTTESRAPHPAFGRCSREDWDAFQFRHCETHMSFIVPETNAEG